MSYLVIMTTETAAKLTKRPSNLRGTTHSGWGKNRHTFAFGNYVEENHVGFRDLRIINEAHLDPGKGLGTQSHRSMELFSYVVEGELQHKNSLGEDYSLRTGDFQHLSAGSGVQLNELNPQSDGKTHFLKMWIVPRSQGGEPRYARINIAEKRVHNGLSLLASPDGEDGSARIRQDSQIFFGDLTAGQTLTLSENCLYPYAWIQMIEGKVHLDTVTLEAGDGAAIHTSAFTIEGDADSEFLLFRLK
ncbi:MAG: pirin family protein [Verrucomicrobiota bacterium]